MNKTLRIALCGEEETKPLADESVEKINEGEGKTITMSGPLAEIYTQALQVVYAKTNKVTDTTSLESQANDALMHMGVTQYLINKANNESNVKPILLQNSAANIAAFAIQDSKVTPDIIATAAATLVNNNQDESRKYFLVIDGSAKVYNGINGNDIPNVFVIEPKVLVSIESLCKPLNINIVYGIEGLVAALKQQEVH